MRRFKRVCRALIFTLSASVPSELEARDIAGFDRLIFSVIFVLNFPFDQPFEWQTCMTTIFKLNTIYYIFQLHNPKYLIK